MRAAGSCSYWRLVARIVVVSLRSCNAVKTNNRTYRKEMERERRSGDSVQTFFLVYAGGSLLNMPVLLAVIAIASSLSIG
jgi:hypothetical protein